MVREDDILLILHNNPWFTPSKSEDKRVLTDAQGNPIIDEDGNQIESPLSYYHICSNGNQITIRVSNHGTALNTWVKHPPDPSLQLQNVSVVFSDGAVSSERKTEEQYTLDSTGKRVKTYKYFVVEQFVYRIQNQSPKSIEKVIKSLEKLDPIGGTDDTTPSEFKDPLRKNKSKKATVQILTPLDSDGKEIDPSTNPVNPRQTRIVNDGPNESTIRLTKQDIRQLVLESVRRILNK